MTDAETQRSARKALNRSEATLEEREAGQMEPERQEALRRRRGQSRAKARKCRGSCHQVAPARSRLACNLRRRAMTSDVAAVIARLTVWSSMADSFEHEAVDDAANRLLLYEAGTDQLWGLRY